MKKTRKTDCMMMLSHSGNWRLSRQSPPDARQCEVIHCFSKCQSQAFHIFFEQGQSDVVHVVFFQKYIFPFPFTFLGVDYCHSINSCVPCTNSASKLSCLYEIDLYPSIGIRLLLSECFFSSHSFQNEIQALLSDIWGPS